MVATVGLLIAALKVLDPALPVGALRVERRRRRTDSRSATSPRCTSSQDHTTGTPRAAWVVVGLPTVETPVELFDSRARGVDGDAGGVDAFCRSRWCHVDGVTTLAVPCSARRAEPRGPALGERARRDLEEAT